MLQRANRLRRSNDYRRVYSQGRTVSGNYLILKYRPGAASVPRIGVVVGSKVSKRAVVRNLIRRRLREILRLDVPLIPGIIDIILTAKPQSKDSTYILLQQEVHGLFRQVIQRNRRTVS